jgi:hypothetical protein
MTLRGCGCIVDTVSVPASNFLLYLLRSTYFYLGSLTRVTDILIAVFDDVQDALLTEYNSFTKQFDDEDRVLAPMLHSFKRIKVFAHSP